MQAVLHWHTGDGGAIIPFTLTSILFQNLLFEHLHSNILLEQSINISVVKNMWNMDLQKGHDMKKREKN